MKRISQWAGGLAVLSLTLAASRPAAAWWPQTHSDIAEAAMRCLSMKNGLIPPSKDNPIPTYFRSGYGFVAHTAQDPDLVKNDALPQLADAEAPEHFIDLELLQGRLLPARRSGYIRLCTELKIDPSKAGYLPYAVSEWTERLSMAFAEYRRWPHNRYIQQKSLVYAGILAHYAADLCQPLHTTIDYDGRTLQDGQSPHTGIHTNVDSLIEHLGISVKTLQDGQSIGAIPELMPGIIAELNESRSHIEQVYSLAQQIPEGRVSQPAKPVVEFAVERAREATRFTAALYFTAWNDSAKVQLPDWLKRDG